MSFKKSLLSIFYFIFIFSCFSAYAAQEPVGLIISMYNGAWVERAGGAKEALTLKAPIYRGDTLSTDATGKAQILFNDDTTLSVAPASVVNIDDFMYNGNTKPYFSVNVVKGASRVISGRIVEQNPIGFKMSSPRGTAGIRGTVVSVIVGPKDDIFSVDSIDPKHFVDISQNANILNITRSATEGYSIIVNNNPQVPNFQRKTSPEERALMNMVFSSLPVPASDGDKSEQTASEGTEAADTGNQGSTSGASKKKTDSGEGDKDTTSEESGAVSGEVDSESVSGGGQAEALVEKKNAEDAGGSISDMDKTQNKRQEEATDLPRTFNAFYQGNLNALKNAPVGFKGEFGFKIDVETGKYTDGYMHGQAKGEGVFNASGGSGSINGNGSFTSGGYSVSGTGTYASADSGSMSGTFTGEETTVEDWLISGNGTDLIGGNGAGTAGNIYVNNPYQDSKANFAGDLTTNSSDANIESKFGFRIGLISGDITDAYMFFQSDSGAVMASGGKGKAMAANADYFGSFDIENFSVWGYEIYGNAAEAHLTGNITDKDEAVLITGGNMGTVLITGGSGARVAELPGIRASSMVYFTSSAEENNMYYKYGFKLNLNTLAITNIYMYGGPRGRDDDVFWASGGSGQAKSDGSVDIRMLNAEYGSLYDDGSYFYLNGKFKNNYAAFNGIIQYKSPGHIISRWPGYRDATVNGRWESLPFMIGYYEGVNTATGARSGFKVNLVSGNVSEAYAAVLNGADKFSASNGSGTLSAMNYSIAWNAGNIKGEGSFASAGKASLSGFLDKSYTDASGVLVLQDASDNTIFSDNFNMNKTSALSGVKAYYSSALAAASGGMTHNGGKIGFAVNLLTSDISDAAFYINQASSNTIVAKGGAGILTGNMVNVSWVDINDTQKTIVYNSARLEGDITGASSLFINDAANPGVDITVDNNVRFAGATDYTGEKKGTVNGTFTSGTQGNYSFNADLYSGVISDASVNLLSGTGNLNVNNGSGNINGGAFDINNFAKDTATGVFADYANGNLSGTYGSADNSFNNINFTAQDSGGNQIANMNGDSAVLRP